MTQFQLTWSGWGGEADHKPTANEPWDQGYMQKGTFWLDTTSYDVWWCSDQGDGNNSDLQWKYAYTFVDDAPVPKTVHEVASPAFNSPRTPSLSADCQVNAILEISLTILQSSEINVEVDDGSGYKEVARFGIGLISLSGLTNTLSFLVPKGASYRILSSGSGTNSIVSVIETY